MRPNVWIKNPKGIFRKKVVTYSAKKSKFIFMSRIFDPRQEYALGITVDRKVRFTKNKAKELCKRLVDQYVPPEFHEMIEYKSTCYDRRFDAKIFEWCYSPKSRKGKT